MTNLLLIKKALLATMVIVVVAFLIGLMSPGSNLSRQFFDFELSDLHYSGAGGQNAALDTNIVLIEIGDDRSEIADQIMAISKGNPKVIGIDAFFENYTDSLSDLKLQMALAGNQNIILAKRFISDGAKENILPNVFALEDAEEKYGYANFIGSSAQSVIRTYSPQRKWQDHTYFSFSSRIAKVFDPEKFNRFSARRNEQEIINYRGNLYSYLNLSRHELNTLDSAGQLTDAFQNKIVLLGFFDKTYPLTMEDIHYSPLNENVFWRGFPDMYGVVMHANILSMIVNEQFLTVSPDWVGYAMAFVLVFLLNLYLLYQYKLKKRSPYAKFILLHIALIPLVLFSFFLVYKRFLLHLPAEPVILTLIVSAVYGGFVVYRSQKLLHENLLLEEKVAQRTEQLRKSLQDLKNAQSQLVQKEKMASLGELTAGIAHEIQNPLNFVNNFSEVSNELMDEMKVEIERGDMEEVKAIANDIKQNLGKIHHHGKRADAIVKGMLQHSRSSSGQKELTDLNALCDEYLRLAYHGLKAKNKTFNADFKTDFDKAVGIVNIIPQDIGRVVLNLITNAFYAAEEKAKQGTENYQPTVWVRTERKDDAVIISVRDNGTGIPANIIDKIFQPFFTTKPTGQGTGLGLSLAYDIVKAHGGELKAETHLDEAAGFAEASSGKPAQAGSTFTIVLPA